MEKKQTAEDLRNAICRMVNNINSETMLLRIYRFIQYVYIYVKD